MLLAERRDLFPDGLDQRVFTPALLPENAFPLADPRMAEIRLGQVLAMTAGVRGNNPCYVNGKPVTIDPPGLDGALACVDDVGLRTSLWCDPGAGYSYATASAHLASIVVRQVSGVELDRYLADRLAGTLGWGKWGWGYRNVRSLTHIPGGGGIAVRATDMLRFGWLLANNGRWIDRQVVPRGHVLHCRERSRFNPHFAYSLQFDVDPAAGALWKHGSGGHCLGVVPSRRLVIWKVGGRDGQYSPADTGMAPSPSAAPPSTMDALPDPAAAWRDLLSLIVSLSR